MGNQGPVQVEARIKNNLPKTKKVLQKPIKVEQTAIINVATGGNLKVGL